MSAGPDLTSLILFLKQENFKTFASLKMFHFGLPSEGLDLTLPGSCAKQLKRYSKLLYLGSGTDALPLPLAKEAFFVDAADGERKCQGRKCSTIENTTVVSQNEKSTTTIPPIFHCNIFLFLEYCEMLCSRMYHTKVV